MTVIIPQTLPLEVALHQAVAHHQAGRLQEAERLYRDILRAQPDHPDANHNLGVLAVQVKQPMGALPHLKTALETKPEQGQYWLSYIEALIQAGQTDAARQVLAQGRQRGLQGEAVEALAGRLESSPGNQPSIQEEQLLANLFNAGRYTDAEPLARAMTTCCPKHGFGWKALGALLQLQGRVKEALVPLKTAAELLPKDAHVHNALGSNHVEQGRFSEAEVSYRHALEIMPDYADAHSNLGLTLQQLGRPSEAEACYRRALEIEPDKPRPRVALAMNTLPIAPQTVKESVAALAEFDLALQSLSDWLASSPIHKERFPEAVGSIQPFHLAYRPGNHISLLSRYGDLVAQNFTSLPTPFFPARGKVKLVVVSQHFRRHSVWDVIVRGVLTHLDRAKFEIILYHVGQIEDEETIFAKSLADGWRDLHTVGGLEGWLAMIANDRPDVIFYPEIGLDPMTLRLASRRLAPLQVASWGHPITTGLPTMDIYFSGELLEPLDADTHYREHLVRLPGTGSCTTPIEIIPEAVPELAAELALRHGVLFVIPQMSTKFEPENDSLYADIASAVGDSTFIFFRDPRFPWATDRVFARLSQVFLERGLVPEQHLLVIPWLSRERFYGLLDLCDIYLDCPSFSGYTTAWQAVHRGIPVVTLEGKFMRQRLAAGLLRKIGLTETIAASTDEYVTIASYLAQECKVQDRRNVRRQAIKSAAAHANHDVGVVRSFEKSLIDALRTRVAI